MALLIDFETSGLPKYDNLGDKSYTALDNYSNCRALQLFIMVCDDKLNILQCRNYILKRDGFSINNSYIHGITNEISDQNGVSFSSILNDLENLLNQTSCIVAHNIKFDINVLKSELYRLNRNDIISIIEKKRQFCTMEMTKHIVCAKNKRGGLKNPKLCELYEYTMKKPMVDAHNAEFDVRQMHEAIKCLFDGGQLSF